MIHTVQDFDIIDKKDIDIFLEFSSFLYDPVDVGNLMFDSCALSKYSLNMWKLSVHVLLKPSLESFEHYFASQRDECSCAVV